MARLIQITKDVEAILKNKRIGLYKVEQKRKWIYLWIRGRKTPIKVRNTGKNRDEMDKGNYKYFLEMLIKQFNKGHVSEEDKRYIEMFEIAKNEIEREHGGVVVIDTGEDYKRIRASQNIGKAREILKKKGRINKEDIEDHALELLEQELQLEREARKMERERIREIKRKIKEIDKYLIKHKDLIEKAIKGYKPKKNSRDYKTLLKIVEKGTQKKTLLNELESLKG